MIEWMSDPNIWISLLTLCALEVVLGIDNVIFISILTHKLPEDVQPLARRVGLSLALFLRLALLFSISWIMGLKSTAFSAFGQDFSGRDIILLSGGLFLIWKSVREIHNKFEEVAEKIIIKTPVVASFWTVIIQILIIDLVFSLDSVITAVGMVSNVWIMVAAVIFSVGVMLFASGRISDFVKKHQAVKVLALAFLILIGAALVAEGLHFHIPKGYIYSPLAFAVALEFLNIRLSTRSAAD